MSSCKKTHIKFTIDNVYQTFEWFNFGVTFIAKLVKVEPFSLAIMFNTFGSYECVHQMHLTLITFWSQLKVNVYRIILPCIPIPYLTLAHKYNVLKWLLLQPSECETFLETSYLLLDYICWVYKIKQIYHFSLYTHFSFLCTHQTFLITNEYLQNNYLYVALAKKWLCYNYFGL